MLKGRLGLETARIPYKDRHGLVWLDRGQLRVEDGCLHFACAGSPGDGATDLPPGDYQVPFQMVSAILLGPGGSVTQDALRLLARHGTALIATGADGVRAYTAPPHIPDRSDLARRHARAWADAEGARLDLARKMYAWRLDEILPHKDIAVLRGIEGSRMKESYKLRAQQFSITWNGRRYDRSNPDAADLPNQALNHAATAVEAAAVLAVTATGTIPQLGFIHEDPGQSFVLDIADLYRDSHTIPIAFQAVVTMRKSGRKLEQEVRKLAGERFRKDQLVAIMMDRIKQLFEG